VDLGFETVGNATLLVHDRGPLLVTDPWLSGSAYFGSWGLGHAIPAEQLDAIGRCRFVWISHGHPDHLHWPSMATRTGTQVLVPDHVGGRVAAALRDAGHHVTVLADRRWTPLSDRVRVCSVADSNQDALLLVDLDGCLVADLNDATDHGWRGFVRRAVRGCDRSFLLQLSGYGDADMINLWTPDGTFIEPGAAQREPVGAQIARATKAFGARYFVPFSSMHRYQRTDSAWANEYTTGIDEHAIGFESRTSELLPAFVRYDCLRDDLTTISPPPVDEPLAEPGAFGDDWSEQLEVADVELARRYFGAIEHLRGHFASIRLRVGGEEHDVVRGSGRVGLTFEAPRGSLVAALEHDVFDDLLIGNFMRTVVSGSTDPSVLYPHFTPYVAKYGDNGLARSEEEVAAYLRAYRARAPVAFVRHRLEQRSRERVRASLRGGSVAYRGARRAYRAVKRS
jgi:hypothetical protein